MSCCCPTGPTTVLTRLLLVLVIGCSGLQAGDTDQAALKKQYPMRWRVCSDDQSGFSFRFPYDYFIPNQYHPGLMRSRTGGGINLADLPSAEGKVDGAVLKKFLEERRRKSAFDLELIRVVRADLPVELKNQPLAEIIPVLTRLEGLSVKAYDYYANSERRPHADKNWAPRGILGVVAEGTAHSALALERDGSIGILLTTGTLTEHDNQAIFDSFEVMVKRGRGYSTWRQQTCLNGKVLDAKDIPLMAVKSTEEKVPWPQAWELETEHYHITSNVSSRHLVLYGKQMEALYAAYTSTYDPDSVPPYKLEMHICRNQEDFVMAGFSQGYDGRPYAGFFAPTPLSIFAYENYRPDTDPYCLFHILAHEASHQFLHVTCNGSSHVPTWINEGLAVTFESSQIKDGKLVIFPPKQRVIELKNAYGRNKQTLVPLKQYLSHYRGIPYTSYAEVYAITQYLIFAGPDSKRLFKEYWQALREGENGTEAFDRIFLADLIKRNGDDRDKAIQVWHDQLVGFVLKKLKQ